MLGRLLKPASRGRKLTGVVDVLSEVRPALDADPWEVSDWPTAENEGRGTTSYTVDSSVNPTRPTTRPPSLLPTYPRAVQPEVFHRPQAPEVCHAEG